MELPLHDVRTKPREYTPGRGAGPEPEVPAALSDSSLQDCEKSIAVA